jgi:phosphopantothenoylcysteine decarboxylase/phosphopantothenate--cysteine ligase
LATKLKRDYHRKSKRRKIRVLITAGPTWIQLDPVRIISNISTGKTGQMLAEKIARAGNQVKLLLGPSPFGYKHNFKGVEVLRYIFFNELRDKIRKILRKSRFDVVIHSAAVCDFWPLQVVRHKFKSSNKKWDVKLVRTPKIINEIKRISPGLMLVGFKFEPQASKGYLIKEAGMLMRQSGSDIVVANTVKNNSYKAYILDSDSVRGPFINKSAMSDTLIKLIQDKIK